MSSSSASIPALSASSSASQSSANSPCAACKFLRRKCQPDCVFAPYFPPDNPQKFVHVHRVFGASNVTKILNDLHPYQREDAVNSLAYEADWRLRDPVYGCVGVISLLQHQLRQLQIDLSCAKNELSKYQAAAAAAAAAGASPVATFVGGAAAAPKAAANAGVGHGLFNPNHSTRLMGIGGGLGVGGLGHDHAFQLPTAREGNPQQQQQHHHHLMSRIYDADLAARLGANNGGYDAGFESTQMTQMNGTAAAAAMVTGIGQFGGQYMRPNTAGGDERPGIGPL